MLHPAISHAPADYRCPFCALCGGAQGEFAAWCDDHVMVQISMHWTPANPGKALVIPLQHHENLYTLPDELAGRIAQVVRQVAVAIRTGYPCDGVTVRQNNEPAGGQDVALPHPRDAALPGRSSLSVAPDAGRRRRAPALHLPVADTADPGRGARSAGDAFGVRRLAART